MIGNANAWQLHLRHSVNIAQAQVLATNVINGTLINAGYVCVFLGCANQATILLTVGVSLNEHKIKRRTKINGKGTAFNCCHLHKTKFF